MATSIKFGTDGWRGKIAEDYTFDNVRLVTQATVEYLRAHGLDRRGLIVGYDTRFASEHFAATVAEVLAGNGIRAYLVHKPTPTPVASYSILTKKAGGAAIITASHNPATDNGYKYKSEYAGSASPEIVSEIESYIGRTPVLQLDLKEAERQKLVERFDATPEYLEHIQGLVDLDAIRRAGLTIIVDSMYGAGMGYYPMLLDGGETRVVPINAERNPLFPGMSKPEPIGDNLAKLKKVVRESGADMGIAFDGDADRVGLVDENGKFVDQLRVFGLLAYYLLEVRGWRGPIVKSISTTSMVNRLGEIYKVPVHETPVGFKHICPKMIETKAVIGGEESGGFAFAKHIPERDGLLSGLFLIDLCLRRNMTPSQALDELFSKVGPHFYDRVDITYPAEQREAILKRVAEARPSDLAGLSLDRIDTRGGYKFYLQDGSWLLIRFSGTEPLLRIYTEAKSPELVDRLLADGRALAGV